MDIAKAIIIVILVALIVVVLAGTLGYLSAAMTQGQSDMADVTGFGYPNDVQSNTGAIPVPVRLAQVVLIENSPHPTILRAVGAMAAAFAGFYALWWLWRLARGVLG